MPIKNIYLLGGWSQNLSEEPLSIFDYMMYGMVNNLTDLTTTGTQKNPSWSPEKSSAPRYKGYSGPVAWTYGGGFCSPTEMPSSEADVNRIVVATQKNKWDAVDFDDECNMNVEHVISAMKILKTDHKFTSYGFIAGFSYNHPDTEAGNKLNQKVKKIVESGQCDKLVHYCYGTSMWSMQDIKNNVRQALDRSIAHGMSHEKVILALTTRGLDDENLNYFLDQITELKIGGLFIWAYHELQAEHERIIVERLKN